MLESMRVKRAKEAADEKVAQATARAGGIARAAQFLIYQKFCNDPDYSQSLEKPEGYDEWLAGEQRLKAPQEATEWKEKNPMFAPPEDPGGAKS